MNQINLLPEEFAKERFRRKIDLMLVILFAVVMISVIMAERISSRKFEVVMQDQTREDGQFAQVDNSAKDFYALLGKRSEYVTDAKRAMELEQKVPRSYLLATLTNACGDELSLDKVAFSINEKIPDKRNGKTVVMNASTATPPKPHENDEDVIDIYGVAASDGDVTDFISRLRSNPVFSEVSLIQTKEWTRPAAKSSSKNEKLFEPNREFTATLKVNPNIDAEKIIQDAAAKTTPAKTNGGEK